MAKDSYGRVAILYPGNHEARRNATHENSRFSDLFRTVAVQGTHVQPAVYHDDFCEDVREQLMQVDGVLVWVNPIEGGRDRSVLDSMLRDVAAAGIVVSTHPDVILKLGTKEVLYRTRDVGWGCDTHLYVSMDQMRKELPARLAAGKARVLKQYRGNGGNGVWKAQLPMKDLRMMNVAKTHCRSLKPLFAFAMQNAGAAKTRSRWVYSFAGASSTLRPTAG